MFKNTPIHLKYQNRRADYIDAFLARGQLDESGGVVPSVVQSKLLLHTLHMYPCVLYSECSTLIQ